jgi:hypothetical protein
MLQACTTWGANTHRLKTCSCESQTLLGTFKRWLHELCPWRLPRIKFIGFSKAVATSPMRTVQHKLVAGVKVHPARRASTQTLQIIFCTRFLQGVLDPFSHETSLPSSISVLWCALLTWRSHYAPPRRGAFSYWNPPPPPLACPPNWISLGMLAPSAVVAPLRLFAKPGKLLRAA